MLRRPPRFLLLPFLLAPAAIQAQVREVYSFENGHIRPRPEFIQPYYSNQSSDFGQPYKTVAYEQVAVGQDTFVVEIQKFKERIDYSNYQVARISRNGEVQAELRNERNWENIGQVHEADSLRFRGLTEHSYFLNIPLAPDLCALAFYGNSMNTYYNADLSIVMLHEGRATPVYNLHDCFVLRTHTTPECGLVFEIASNAYSCTYPFDPTGAQRWRLYWEGNRLMEERLSEADRRKAIEALARRCRKMVAHAPSPNDSQQTASFWTPYAGRHDRLKLLFEQLAQEQPVLVAVAENKAIRPYRSEQSKADRWIVLVGHNIASEKIRKFRYFDPQAPVGEEFSEMNWLTWDWGSNLLYGVAQNGRLITVTRVLAPTQTQ